MLIIIYINSNYKIIKLNYKYLEWYKYYNILIIYYKFIIYNKLNISW